MIIDWNLVGTIGAICFAVPFCAVLGLAVGRFLAGVFSD